MNVLLPSVTTVYTAEISPGIRLVFVPAQDVAVCLVIITKRTGHAFIEVLSPGASDISTLNRGRYPVTYRHFKR